jgi:hypothetical protein
MLAGPAGQRHGAAAPSGWIDARQGAGTLHGEGEVLRCDWVAGRGEQPAAKDGSGDPCLALGVGANG